MNESENQIGFNSVEGGKSFSDTGKLLTDVATGTTAFIERVSALDSFLFCVTISRKS